MNCMRCGIEIEDGQVFCENCLADMKRHPVKPETRIQLPSRPAPEAVKKQAPRKRVPTPEERIYRLRKVITWLSVALVTALLFLGFSLYLLMDMVSEKPQQENIGQNYSTIGDSQSQN